MQRNACLVSPPRLAPAARQKTSGTAAARFANIGATVQFAASTVIAHRGSQGNAVVSGPARGSRAAIAIAINAVAAAARARSARVITRETDSSPSGTQRGDAPSQIMAWYRCILS